MRTKPSNNRRTKHFLRATVGLLTVLLVAAAPSQALSLPGADLISQDLSLSTPLGNIDTSVHDGAAHACADLHTPSLPVALPALPVPLPVALPDVSSLTQADIAACVDADASGIVSDVTDTVSGATETAEEAANQTVDQADGIVDKVLSAVKGVLDGLFSIF